MTGRQIAGPPRYAIYLAAERHHPLGRFGIRWLGRDAEATLRARRLPDRLSLPGIADDAHEAWTAAAARYGFHATLRAPFRLAAGRSERSLEHVLRRFARSRKAFRAPPLRLGTLDGFLALLQVRACPPLRQLADACVRRAEPLCAPPDPQELARRRAPGLSPRQRLLLDRWGYPFVFDQWRFHMTLTDRLPPQSRQALTTALRPHLRPLLQSPLFVDAICLFRQDCPEKPFRLIRRLRFDGLPYHR